MNTRLLSSILIAAALVAAYVMKQQTSSPDPLASAVLTQKAAAAEEAEWGTYYEYFSGETYGTTDVLSGVAVIDAGKEIHPPHQHAEEEYLMVMGGNGTWHLNGEEFPATAGDMLYAAPWDIHGISNTGDTPLSFVFWKWNSKGVAVRDAPAGDH